MKVQWKTLIVTITLWFALELLLSCLGLDTIADYSEYILDQKTVTTLVKKSEFSPQFPETGFFHSSTDYYLN